jgi:4'-phosphopantetheinyl transferase
MCTQTAGGRHRLVAAVRGGEVHVWSVALRGSLSPAAVELLSEPERERMDRFVAAADQRRYGLAHVALRLILSDYLAQAPAEIELRVAALGKPSVAAGELEYSLAHAGDRALVAVAWGWSVGVDLERVVQFDDAVAAARAALTAAEREHVLRAADDRARELLRLWTRKEALLKATGEGVRAAPRELDVLDDEPRPGWRVSDLKAGPGWVGAVAVPAAVTQIRQLRWQKKSRPAGDGPARASGEEVLL